MHPCLNIDEIALLICSFLCSEDLLSFALTCTRLKQPALDTLWEELPGILPFLKLFPDDAWSEQATWRGSIILKRPIVSADWSLPASRALCVRDISVHHSDVATPLLESAVCTFPGIYIFPRLQSLHFFTPMDLCVPFAKAILSPSLTHLTLRSTGDAEAIAVLSQLGTTCPSMISFTFRSSVLEDRSNTSAVCASLSQAVCGWNKLQKLHTPVLGVETFKHLSQLPNFNHLGMECNVVREMLPDLQLSEGFSSLSSINVSDCSLDRVTDILNASKTRGLGWIRLQLPDEGDRAASMPEWQDYYAAVAKCSSDATTLSLVMDGVVENCGEFLEVDVLRPLFEAKKLTSFIIPSCYHFYLTDSFIEELAMASPNLISLVIGTKHAMFLRLLTLNSYVHVFKHCSKIKMLGLVINADTDQLEEKMDDKPFEQHGKDFMLCVGDSTVKDPPKVAAFLSKFFYEPIGHIIPALNANTDLVKVWNEVEHALSMYISARVGLDERE